MSINFIKTKAFGAAALAAILLASAALPALASERPSPKLSKSQFELPQMSNSKWRALERKASRERLLPVIVALNVSTRAPHHLTSGEAKTQRAAITSTRGSLLSELRGTGFRNLKVSDAMPLVAFHATPDAIAKLRDSELVAAVTEDREVVLDSNTQSGQKVGRPRTPKKTRKIVSSNEATPMGTSPNGSNTQLPFWWDYKQIGVDRAVASGYTGTGQTVAIIDSGVDRNHSWLAGRVVNEACFSTTIVGYSAGDCPNGRNIQYGLGAAAPCSYHADCAHGTHVAHTAAGHWGVAPGARIIAVQIFHRNPISGKRPTYWESDVVWALSHVYNLRSSHRIAAVNMSIGGGLYTGYCDNTRADNSTNATYLTGWINALKSAGIATVVSSGNGNSSNAIGHPACISGAISVGNTTLDGAGYDAVYGNVTGGSNSNATLDLLAPGTDICSAVPGNAVECGWIGTSMAAPHVAGAIAVLRQYRPSSTVDQVQNALRLSGPGVYDSRNGITRVRINVFNALSKI